MLLESTKLALQQIVTIIEIIQDLTPVKREYLYIELNIGKHIRHISDHFLALKRGLNTKIIDYNTRNRGTKIEIDGDVALFQIHHLLDWLNTYEAQLNRGDINQCLKIISEIDCIQTQTMTFESTLAREFLYLINHTIHHAAHISVIVKHQGIEVPLNTGMAPCTLTFLRSQSS